MGQSPASDQYTTDLDERPFLQGNAEFGARYPSPKWYCDAASKTVPKGTLLLSVRAPVGALNEADRLYGIGRGLCGVMPEPSALRKDFAWFLLTVIRVELAMKATGSTYDAVSADAVGNIVAVVPSGDEQRAIADFLDRETAKIDTLIAKKRTLIERLKEKRTALISRTVTHGLPPDAARAAGLDPHPRLKPSGIDWLGDVPEHWVTGNLRRFALMKTGHTPSRGEPQYWEDCDIPWFTLADVWQLRDERRIYLSETKERISRLGLANSAAELLPAGTVVFSRTASVGFSGIMPVPMATTQDFWNWIPSAKLVSEYLLFVFRAIRQEFERLTMGSTHKTIYQPDAARLCVAVPPIAEQKAIAEFLSSETAKLDGLTDRVETAIERLREYRTALIAAAVTGKIDVRAAAA
jgi:type I restriction enzyme S subunit